MRRARSVLVLALGLATGLTGCTSHLLSRANVDPSDARPVVRIETTGGVELGAATEHGILFLGRTAQSGPCRVHYFLGNQVFVEDCEVESTGSVFYRATIDLKHQRAQFLGRDVQPRDALIAMHMRGHDTDETTLRLADSDRASGDVARHPGRALPVGTPVFVREDGELRFVGLIAAEATLTADGGASERFVLFTGADRLREFLLVPERDPEPRRAKHRPDGITVK